MRLLQVALLAMFAAVAGCKTTGPGAPVGTVQQTFPKPNLNQPWDSDYGRIYFSEGYYDVPGKTIEGQLYQQGGKWFFEGRWGRTNSRQSGPVKFEFTRFGDGFSGSFTSANGSTKKSWNGVLAKGGTAGTRPTQTFPQPQNPQPQPPRNVQVEHQRPNLNVNYSSDFGVVDFQRGLYENTNQTLRGQLVNRNGKWIWRGRWGRNNSNAGGDVRFTFALDGRSFSGYYVNTNGQRKPWSGRAGTAQRIATYRDNPAQQPPLPAQQPPLGGVYSSDFGPIDFVRGFYDTPNKTLRGRLVRRGSKYVWVGRWGRRDSANGGAVEFTFSYDGRSFSGHYITTDGSKRPWNGRRS